MKAITTPDVTVVSDHDEIRVVRPGHDPDAVRWSDVTRVLLVVTAHPALPVSFEWVVKSRGDRSGIAIPLDADGEHDFVLSMQVRLPGFDRMAVIEAFSAPGSGEFEVWNAEWPEP